jgi:AraC-like DNA-binding protein
MEPLFESRPASGCDWEQHASVRYHWRCDNRGPLPFVILQATRSGWGWFRTGGKVWSVEPGKAFVSLVPEPADYGFPDGASVPWTFAWLSLYGEEALRLCGRLRDTFGPVVRFDLDKPYGREFLRLIREGRRLDRTEAAVAIYRMVLGCARDQETRQRGRRTGPTVLEALTPATVKELAAERGWSREHFTRVFRREHGQSPAAWLKEQRVAAAQRMMRDGVWPLHEVARRCGFSGTRQLRRALLRANVEDRAAPVRRKGKATQRPHRRSQVRGSARPR